LIEVDPEQEEVSSGQSLFLLKFSSSPPTGHLVFATITAAQFLCTAATARNLGTNAQI
jgi:hypothetical protein